MNDSRDSSDNSSSPQNAGGGDNNDNNAPMQEGTDENVSRPGRNAVRGGGSQEGSSRKKRGRNEEAGASSSTTGSVILQLQKPKPKRRVELLDPPSCDPNCVVCGKQFGSWKALFGHMRSHPDRQWRGAFPPPTGTWEPPGGSPGKEANALALALGRPRADAQHDQIASTLLNVAEGVLNRMAEGSSAGERGGHGETSGFASSPRRGLGIDLNEPHEEYCPSPKFDLNVSASESDGENST